MEAGCFRSARNYGHVRATAKMNSKSSNDFRWSVRLTGNNRKWMGLGMRPCKIDSENWTYFRFHFQRVSFRSLIVELTTILDKTQVWPRKSILYVQISLTLPTKYF